VKFAAMGRTRTLYDSMRAAVAKGHELVLVGTAPAAPEYDVAPEDFARLAGEAGVPYFCASSINRPEFLELAAQSGAGVAISVNWPTLVGPEMLARFEHGVVNAHAGDLPRFRGNATPNWAILAGEEAVVLTLHRMVEQLDAGPILAQRAFPLTRSTYVGDVYRFLARAVPELFVEVLDGLEQGTLAERPQPEAPELSLRCFPRQPGDGLLDWQQPAEALSRLVRASAEPFAGAYSYLGTDPVVVWRARPEPLGCPWLGVPGQVVDVRAAAGEVAVLAGDGVLVLEEIEIGGGGRRRPSACLRSTRLRLGGDAFAQVAALTRRVRDLEALLGGRGSTPSEPVDP